MLTEYKPMTTKPVHSEKTYRQIDALVEEAMHREHAVETAELMSDKDFSICQGIYIATTHWGRYVLFRRYGKRELEFYGSEWR